MVRLRPVVRAVVRRKVFQKPIADYLAGTIKWSDPSLKPVKDLIRKVLKAEQDEICPYCQRLIVPERRNVSEHIEHYLDKSRACYRKFAFTATNLVLSCQGCNVEKGTRDLVVKGKTRPVHFSQAAAPFRWPHPYFDSMSDCVLKRNGPVYSVITGSGREAEAQQMIVDLKLDTIRSSESRHGRLVAERERLYAETKLLVKQTSPESRARLMLLVERLEAIDNELR